MMTRTHYNDTRNIALVLKAQYQALERIIEETTEYPIPRCGAFIWQLEVTYDDLQTLIVHLDETIHDIGKHLGVNE